MQKRDSLVLDDAYYDHSDPRNTEAYLNECFAQNRADSIRWACLRCNDDDEIRRLVFGLRWRFKEVVQPEFAALLDEAEDPNHFFVFVGRAADKGNGLAVEICRQLKSDLNLDLFRELFDARPPRNPRPKRKTIRLPGKRSDVERDD